MPYPFTGADVVVPFEDLLNDVVESAAATVQSGGGTITPSIVGTPRVINIPFPVAFSTPPIVVANARTTNPHSSFAAPQTVTATGFNISICNTATLSDVAFTWIAHGT